MEARGDEGGCGEILAELGRFREAHVGGRGR